MKQCRAPDRLSLDSCETVRFRWVVEQNTCRAKCCIDRVRIRSTFSGNMAIRESMVRFLDIRGRLAAIEINRSDQRPVIATVQAALLAMGVTVTSYEANSTSSGLDERLEVSAMDGEELDEAQSKRARSAILPLVLGSD